MLPYLIEVIYWVSDFFTSVGLVVLQETKIVEITNSAINLVFIFNYNTKIIISHKWGVLLLASSHLYHRNQHIFKNFV